MTEQWADIPGWPNYQASSFGRIKSLHRVIIISPVRKKTIRERILKQSIADGYWYVGLRRDNFSHRKQTHRLVAFCFKENPLNLPEVNHKDLNKLNNSIDNLEWVTTRENASHAKLNTKKSSIYTGVSFSKKYNYWCAFIRISGKNKNLGTFKDEHAAHIAYTDALRNNNFKNKYIDQTRVF